MGKCHALSGNTSPQSMCVQVLFSYIHTHNTQVAKSMLRRSILLHLSAVPNTRPAPFSASRAPTHGAQLTPAADATLGHLVDLGVENQVEPTRGSCDSSEVLVTVLNSKLL